jgi:hypothetical protein
MSETYFLKITVLISALFVWSVAVSSGDTLFKGKTPLAIGHGIKLGKKLHWTDCNGKNPKDLDAPPYWMDAGANCDLSPYSFGLVVSGTDQNKAVWVRDDWTTTTVRDATFSKKLFPAAKSGDSMMVFRGEDSITFKYDGKVQELKTKTPLAKAH